MSEVKFFYLKNCPHCIKANNILTDLRKQEKYSNIQIEMIEESIQSELANQYDYFYVPTFFVNDKKICEGVLTPEQVESVLIEALK